MDPQFKRRNSEHDLVKITTLDVEEIERNKTELFRNLSLKDQKGYQRVADKLLGPKRPSQDQHELKA